MRNFAPKARQPASDTRRRPPVALSPIQQLQRRVGNRVLQRMVQAHAGRAEADARDAVRIQPKLTINTAGDAYEQEADRVAEQVMRMPEPSVPSQVSADVSGHVTTPVVRVQTKSMQAGDSGGAAAPPIVHDVLRSPGQPLDASARAFMEPRFGQDFGQVRVHTDARAAESAAAIGAAAYTVGRDVVFAPGRYAPATGDRLLAHELTHVLQQRPGRSIAGAVAAAPVQVQMQHERELAPADKTRVATRQPPELVTQQQIRNAYFNIVRQGPAHYVEAIRFLINKYGLDASHAELYFDPSVGGSAAAVTGGNVGDDIVPVRFGWSLFSKHTEFGFICRCVAHELQHSKQKAEGKITDHEEREFLAYYDEAVRKDLPQAGAIQTEAWIAEALRRYGLLTPAKQKEYAKFKKELDDMRTKKVIDPLFQPSLQRPTSSKF